MWLSSDASFMEPKGSVIYLSYTLILQISFTQRVSK